MKWHEFIGLILVIFVLGVIVYYLSHQPAKIPDDNTGNGDPTYSWGVDSASYTNEELYMCVHDKFGKPKVWGRYLGTIENISEGLDTEEVIYLHEQGAHILIIYNHFSDATGYDHGVEEANNAIALAKEIDVPKGVAIFGDIEPKYPVNTDFIKGWYDTLEKSLYKPALYGVFNEGSDVRVAYENLEDHVQDGIVIWTAFPQEGITTKDEQPTFAGEGPEGGMVYGWQYGQDAEQCNIDTNLFDNNLIGFLWKAE